MFERRLKIFLFFILIFAFGLILRATQIQLLERKKWTDQAAKTMKQSQLVETTRGAILDRTGKRVLAYDAPCIDACVDYRAITEDPDPKWLLGQADQNLHQMLTADQIKQARRSGDWARMEEDESAHVRGELAAMWTELAHVSGKTPDEIDDIRRSIVTEVETRRRYLWWYNYQTAESKAKHQAGPSWYEQFLSDSGDDNEVDKFEFDVGEQRIPHVVIHPVDSEQQAELARYLERFPALSLQPSKHREYPYQEIACHILGWMGQVGPEHMGLDDPKGADELRRYFKNDAIGRTGVEALCEETLRGSKGKIVKDGATNEVVSEVTAVPGKDVRLSIDIELQKEIQQAFVEKRLAIPPDYPQDRWNQHGAAVVLNIATNEVLAMVSNPGFDVNMIGTEYSKLEQNDIDAPLSNRATQMALEPGSTAKTIVGSGAITHGFKTAEDTIECTGYLVLGTHRYSIGRCWVAAGFFKKLDGNVAHHPIPTEAPHPTGWLTISDGLERSCNVVFETIADKMGGKELNFWFNQFGLGRPTEVGIDEVRGRIPPPVDFSKSNPLRTCFAGIGQGDVAATPLQMANVAATIARDGVWMRPRLVAPEDFGRATTKPAAPLGPDRIDLHLSKEALDAVHEGMRRVCNTRAGTGLGIRPENQYPEDKNDPLIGLVIAGKTGSAQTALMTVPHRDASGAKVVQGGSVLRDRIELGQEGTEGWYQGIGEENHMVHAWFIGYAPYDHPQVAFAVMVQYGESGGHVAGAIAHDVLEACVHQGYLSVNPVNKN
jgi:penicillin-binding protein 2